MPSIVLARSPAQGSLNSMLLHLTITLINLTALSQTRRRYKWIVPFFFWNYFSCSPTMQVDDETRNNLSSPHTLFWTKINPNNHNNTGLSHACKVCFNNIESGFWQHRKCAKPASNPTQNTNQTANRIQTTNRISCLPHKKFFHTHTSLVYTATFISPRTASEYFGEHESPSVTTRRRQPRQKGETPKDDS